MRTSALTQDALKTDEDPKEVDFFTKQARLQIEARMALAQAKDIAHLQMEVMTWKMLRFFWNFFFLRFFSNVSNFEFPDGTSQANEITHN